MLRPRKTRASIRGAGINGPGAEALRPAPPREPRRWGFAARTAAAFGPGAAAAVGPARDEAFVAEHRGPRPSGGTQRELPPQHLHIAAVSSGASTNAGRRPSPGGARAADGDRIPCAAGAGAALRALRAHRTSDAPRALQRSDYHVVPVLGEVRALRGGGVPRRRLEPAVAHRSLQELLHLRLVPELVDARFRLPGAAPHGRCVAPPPECPP
mmetsp:Transcript_26228/g.75689  ORF Transcript_26228/g.75689 Transcript_26228/m.75689 type:complete len:212 (-) Transcript_26228:8-643(-)